MGRYVDPLTVKEPAGFELCELVYDEGSDNGFAAAWGTWNGEAALGLRWNGKAGPGPNDYPVLRSGAPAWFIVPGGLIQPILQALVFQPDISVGTATNKAIEKAVSMLAEQCARDRSDDV